MMNTKELREELADLEHQQWIHWSQAVASNLLDNIKANPYEAGIRALKQHQKWLPNWKPYDELDEVTKEFDRVWADKVLKLLKAHLENILDELLDPESIANYGKTQQERMAINSYIRDFIKFKLKTNEVTDGNSSQS